jgi:hypothetical protein
MHPSWGGGLGRFLELAVGHNNGVVWGIGADRHVYVYNRNISGADDECCGFKAADQNQGGNNGGSDHGRSSSLNSSSTTTTPTISNSTAASAASNAWERVPACLDDRTRRPHGIRSVSVGCGVVWACTMKGKILVRWGVTRATPAGTRWEQFRSEEASRFSPSNDPPPPGFSQALLLLKVARIGKLSLACLL